MHGSRLYVSYVYVVDCVEFCSNETAGADISYKCVSNLSAALVATTT